MSKINTPPSIKEFQQIIMDYYRQEGRRFLWRDIHEPYNVLVSEIMLQQTQTERVREKYAVFIRELPHFESLAKAPLQKVLSLWQGLGYNRRAIALKKSAEIIQEKHHGILPDSFDELLALPGIGKATAASIQAFAFNKPSAFIETNIRRVYIHFFFHDKEGVHDSEIMNLVEKTLLKEHPRDWYYALMDYGVILKKEGSNPNRRSAHYTKQSKFEGSRRQVRGKIVKVLSEVGTATITEIAAKVEKSPSDLNPFLEELEKEGFLLINEHQIKITP